MNAIRSLLMNIRRVLACAGEMCGYALMFLWAVFCPKAVLAARFLTVESQLAACKHEIASNKRPRPRFTPGLRLLWVVLSKLLDRWEDVAHLMQPATVKKWHTVSCNGAKNANFNLRGYAHCLCDCGIVMARSLSAVEYGRVALVLGYATMAWIILAPIVLAVLVIALPVYAHRCRGVCTADPSE
jgi:hypothetical protein